MLMTEPRPRQPGIPQGSEGAKALTVRELEQLLFLAFPAADAQEGDRIGLLVGDPGATVTRCAIALDASASAIEAAAERGCNVLISHHPVYWRLPTLFLREGVPAASGGDGVYAAARRGVSLISMHTNLDCSWQAREMLLAPAGFAFAGQLRDKDKLGQLGRPLPVARPPQADGPAVSLGDLALAYRQSFGAVAKVWGDPSKRIRLLAACSGGGGELADDVLASGADCYVTGEVLYHVALALSEAGVALIELGHDRSELPYRHIIEAALLDAGMPHSSIEILGPCAAWWQAGWGDGAAEPEIMGKAEALSAERAAREAKEDGR
jgi:putative NIF3 family GTP cyclohydrolase 1 type 2